MTFPTGIRPPIGHHRPHLTPEAVIRTLQANPDALALRQGSVDAANALWALKRENDIAQKALDSLRDRKTALQAKNQALRAQSQRQDEQIAALLRSLESLQDEVRELKQRLNP
jgi:predicted nuclease with TOPRIM domain